MVIPVIPICIQITIDDDLGANFENVIAQIILNFGADHFCLFFQQPYDLYVVAEYLTKERVRQIKEKALRKLRNESSVLFDYL